MKNVWNTVKNIAVPLIVGGIVGLVISGSIDYEFLAKPPLAPPKMLFPIMWSVLYLLMGIGYAILDRRKAIQKDTRELYYLQLAVNAIWPILFFNLKWRLLAFLWLLLLAVLVALMIKAFYKQSKLAAYLQIPYLLWTVFAAYLNLGIYLLN